MKFIKVMAIMALTFNAAALQAAGCHPQAYKDISVERYTLRGDGTLFIEDGILYLDRGFVPSFVRDFPYDPQFHSSDYPPTTLSAINGQFAISLSSWTILETATDSLGVKALCNFSRSAATYPLEGVPWVIVTATPGGSGGGSFVKTPKVSISAPVPACTETAGAPCQFLISLNGPSRKKIRVRFTVSGKAIRGKDYVRFPTTVMIPSGSTTATINVTPIDDARRENTENVKVKLLPPQSAASFRVRRASASVQIFDND